MAPASSASSGADAAAPVTNPGGAASSTGARTGGGTQLNGATTSTRPLSRQSGRRSTAATSTPLFIESFSRWEFWWDNNKDAFIDLKARLGDNARASSALGAMTGRGRKSKNLPERPDPATIRTEVIPFLMQVAASSDQRDILDSTVLALGRISSDADTVTVTQGIVPLLASRELSVSSSAALALGVLGAPRNIPLLTHLMLDDAEGRKLAGSGGADRVPWLVRAFAAIALGLIDDASAVPQLEQLIETTPSSDRDLKACAVVALGLMTNDARPRIVNFMTGLLADKRLDATVRSYIPTALGKLGGRAAIAPLLAVLGDERTEHVVRQSAAIGLGRLSGIEDEAVIDALAAIITSGGDALTRHFAFISLAKIGAADTAPSAHEAAHRRITGLLSEQLTDPKRRTNRSWAGLSAALYGRVHPEAAATLVPLLRDAYTEERDPSYKAAFAVALGLLDDRAMAPVIHADLLETQQEDFNGYACIALGLMRYEEAAATVRRLCRDPSVSTTYRLQTATSLGLMADPDAVDLLLDVLHESETLGVSAAVAQAIGLIGDVRSIGTLRAVAGDEDATDLVRAFACVALGLVGERTPLPWNAVIGADNNYAAGLPSVVEILDIL